MIKVAVVILNWNGRGFLEKFLPSVTQNIQESSTEVWVADNGSTDDSVAYIKASFPKVRTLVLDKNYGFTGGYNRALKEIEAEYYVLLNSDVEVAVNWIEPIIEKMDSDPLIAAAMPKILAHHDKKTFEYAGAAGGYIDKFGYPFCRGRLISEVEEDLGQYNDYREVFWATGACMFVRAKTYHEVGGLDEDFFAHMEEIDLCWRLKNRGFKVVYVPDSTVYHVGGGTLPNENPRKLYLNYRNNLLLLFKNLSPEKFISTLFLRMVLDGVSAMLYLLQGKFAYFTAVLKAHGSFYAMKNKFRAKRKENIKCTKQYDHSQIYPKSLVYSYFAKRLKHFSDLSF